MTPFYNGKTRSMCMLSSFFSSFSLPPFTEQNQMKQNQWKLQCSCAFNAVNGSFDAINGWQPQLCVCVYPPFLKWTNCLSPSFVFNTRIQEMHICCQTLLPPLQWPCARHMAFSVQMVNGINDFGLNCNRFKLYGWAQCILNFMD